MAHAHQYRVTLYLLLGLPGPDGMADRVIRWDCSCGQFVIIDGAFKLGHPLHTPAFWEALLQDERRRGTPEAREAQRQNQWRWR